MNVLQMIVEFYLFIFLSNKHTQKSDSEAEHSWLRRIDLEISRALLI